MSRFLEGARKKTRRFSRSKALVATNPMANPLPDRSPFLSRFVAVAITLASAAGVQQAKAGQPEIQALPIPEAPELDGRLDEPFWQKAEGAGNFHLFQGNGKQLEDTAFRLAYDDAWLYIGIDCKNKDLRALQPRVKGRDKQASNDESVEIFLDPGTDGGTYFHYMLNFGGARDERRSTGSNIDKQWDTPWQSAVDVREDGWSAEVAIPLCVLAEYGAMDGVRLNIARNRRIPVIDSQNVVIEDHLQFSSWAPVQAGFNETGRFGWVKGFPADLKPRVPLLAGLHSARVKPFRMENGQAFYEVEAEVRGFTPQAGEVVLTVRDQPAQGAPGEVSRQIALKGRSTAAASIMVPVQGLGERRVSLKLGAAGREEVFEILEIADLSPLNAMSAFLDRNYYTTEGEAFVVCRVLLPEEARKGVSLEVRKEGGAVLAGSAVTTSENRVPVALADLPEGATPLEAVLAGADGKPLFKVPVDLTKRKPKPGLEWKINREQRVLLNNGKPFFPFGVVGEGRGDSAALEKIAAANLNTVIAWNPGSTPAQMAELASAAGRQGLFLVAHPDLCGTQPGEWEAHKRYSGPLLEKIKRYTEGGPLRGIINVPISVAERDEIYGEYYGKNIGRYMEAVAAVKDQPGLAAYFIMDEPMQEQLLGEYKFGRDFYKRINESDGYHPVMVNYSSYIPEGDHYVDWCDILTTDPYWVPPAGTGTRTTPNHVSKIAWLTRERALPRRQPVWQILTGSRWSRCRKRPLNEAEIRAQTFLAAIHGAAGIFYFHHDSIRPLAWDAIRRLGGEFRLLEPFLAGPGLPHSISNKRAVLEAKGGVPDFQPSPFNPAKEEYPDVQSVLLRNGGGDVLLLAANSRHHPVECRFRLAGLQGAAGLSGGEHAAPGGEFTETIEPYGTRAWKLAIPPPDGPISLDVWQTVLKGDLANPETVFAHEFRPGRKNALPNPGFEDSSAPEWVDYCMLSPGGGIEAEGAFEGGRCVRLEHSGARASESLQLFCDPQEDAPKSYTFSVHLKGSRDGLKAWIRGTHLNSGKEHGENLPIELSTEWQRFSITGVLPARSSEAIFEVRLQEPGTLWADAAQLERGTEPTPYEN
jgi:hypothetical protein